MGCKEAILYCKGGEALEQVVQKGYECPISASIQGPVGWIFKVPFKPSPSVIQQSRSSLYKNLDLTEAKLQALGLELSSLLFSY